MGTAWELDGMLVRLVFQPSGVLRRRVEGAGAVAVGLAVGDGRGCPTVLV